MKLLDETGATNQLVDACRMYLASEIFVTEFKVLSLFKHLIMPCRMHTLNGFIIHIHQVNVVAPTSGLAKIIISEFCVAAVAAIKLQGGHECGFDNDGEIQLTVIPK